MSQHKNRNNNRGGGGNRNHNNRGGNQNRNNHNRGGNNNRKNNNKGGQKNHPSPADAPAPTPPAAKAPRSTTNGGPAVVSFVFLFLMTFILIFAIPHIEQKIQYKDIEIPVKWVLWTVIGLIYLVFGIVNRKRF